MTPKLFLLDILNILACHGPFCTSTLFFGTGFKVTYATAANMEEYSKIYEQHEVEL